MKSLAKEANIKCVLNVAEDSPPVGHRCGFPPRMHGQVGSPRATGNLHVPSSSPRPGFPSGVRSVEAYTSGPMELPPHIYAPDSFTQTLMTIVILNVCALIQRDISNLMAWDGVYTQKYG